MSLFFVKKLTFYHSIIGENRMFFLIPQYPLLVILKENEINLLGYSNLVLFIFA
jgi:hypothetical protein